MRSKLSNVSKNLVALALGLVLAAVAVVCVDAGLGLLWKSKLRSDPKAFLRDPDFIPAYRNREFHRENFTWWPEPNSKLVTRMRDPAGSVLYDIEYEFDDFGHRRGPARDSAEVFDLFLGCSFTFGTGLRDSETLPAAFARLHPDRHVYNFAMAGYGPSDLLARARAQNPSTIVREGAGRIFYVFIDDHVRRALGSFAWLGFDGENKPAFEVDGGGALVLRGDFGTTRPVLHWFAKRYFHSTFGKFWPIDFPETYSNEELRHFVSIVGELKATYVKALPRSPFYFVFYPGETEFADRLMPELRAQGIDVLGPFPPFSTEDGQPVRQYDDFHPSAHANELLARLIGNPVSK
ncbi:MAG: hypothetical protein AAB250_03165 [Bdellovibrionota bacterium]